MTLFTKLAARILGRLLKRPVTLDQSLPLNLVVGRLFALGLGLARGILFARRLLILERGASISNSSKFSSGGGLIRIGAHARIECTSKNGVAVGRNFKLGAFSRVVASGTLSDLGLGIEVGDNVGISEFAYIGGAGGVKIGSDVIIGQYFSAHPENHVFSDPTKLIREQGVSREGIEIGPDCWIGAKVTILDGAKLGRGCVVAAGSVVNRSFPANSIIGGVPARLLRERDPINVSRVGTLPEADHDR